MKHKTGQNFLVDKRIAIREIQHASIDENDVVLEIGPGMGILTMLLAEKAKKVIAVELDTELVDKLKTFLPENVLLVHEDALKVDFKSLPSFNKIVSNLPFHISSPITFKFLQYDFSSAVLIYQKEFADRMVAQPGGKHYSRLSVGVYYKADCEILETIPKECFFPQPQVDSCMVRLTPRKFPAFPVLDEKFFFDLTRELFNHRRKKIKNTLGELYRDVKFEDLPYLDKRVEELTPEQIGELSDFLYKMNLDF
jgi:16S rRNA (adenine1518-N6/adenine1519-N6)-dimethyltransferase